MSKFKVGDFVYVDQYQPEYREVVNCFGVVERVNNDNTYKVKVLYNNDYTTNTVNTILFHCESYDLTPAIEELDDRISKAQKLKNELMWKTLNQ